jgi:NADH dehydrogenase
VSEILVAGATGQLGGEIARRLLDGGRSVRVLVRQGSDHGSLVAQGAEPVFGDLKDRSSLDPACAGIDTVVTTANSAQRGGDDNPTTVDLHGNQNLIDAAAEAGVRHFIFTSALGSQPDSPNPFMAAKARSQAACAESGMRYTILLPNIFMDVWVALIVAGPALRGEEVVYVGSGERRHSMVARDDVASFAVGAVDHPDALDTEIVIGGPRPFTWHDAVAVFERTLGRSIPHRGVPPGEPIGHVPPPLMGLLTYMDTYDSPVPMEETASRFGVRLTSLEEWAQGVLAAARPS